MPLALVRRALVAPALALVALGGAGMAWAQQVAWAELTPIQQVALAPLATEWPQLSDEQQHNWMAVSRHYARMSRDERKTLQDRMAEWAELSPKERSLARFNFNAIQSNLSAAERRAKWEEYRALPDAEKQRLARNRRVSRGASPALRPPPPGQLARPPVQPSAQPSEFSRPPEVYNAPRDIRRVLIPADRQTLLPQILLDAERGPAAPRPRHPHPLPRADQP